MSTAAQLSSLLQFSANKGVNQLYMNTGGVLVSHPIEFANLISSAHAQGIQVYALDGDKSWALTANHSVAVSRVQEVIDYNNAHPTAVFDGIQHDVEPYLLTEWNTDFNGTAVQFLDMLVQCQNLVNQSGGLLKYSVAVPFWYDEGLAPVSYNGQSKFLSYHVLDIVDEIAIMDYRDSAGGTISNQDGQIDHGKQEINYATGVGKKAMVGAETMPPDGTGIPGYITYNDEGLRYMNRELNKVDSYFGSQAGYGGIAIHHYDTYKSMKN
jgi:hypothetical protein